MTVCKENQPAEPIAEGPYAIRMEMDHMAPYAGKVLMNYRLTLEGLLPDCSEVDVGKLSVFRLSPLFWIAGRSLQDLLDDEHLDGFCEVLCDEDGTESATPDRLFEQHGCLGGMNKTVNLVDRLEIMEPYRGKGLGRALLGYFLEEHCSTESVSILRPAPLQCFCARGMPTKEARAELSRRGYSKLPRNLRQSTAKLRRLYAELGFKPVHYARDYMSVAHHEFRARETWERAQYLTFGWT